MPIRSNSTDEHRPPAGWRESFAPPASNDERRRRNNTTLSSYQPLPWMRITTMDGGLCCRTGKPNSRLRLSGCCPEGGQGVLWRPVGRPLLYTTDLSGAQRKGRFMETFGNDCSPNAETLTSFGDGFPTVACFSIVFGQRRTKYRPNGSLARIIWKQLHHPNQP